MALALSQAAPLRAEVQLAQALSEFEVILNDEQKASFRALKQNGPPNVQDVVRLTAQIDHDIVQQRKSRRCVGPRFMSVLQAVQQFTTVADMVISGSQNLISSSVWGVAKLSLQSAMSYSLIFEKISTLFMTIGRSCPRYRYFAALFPWSQSLQDATCKYFTTFVCMCKQIILFLRKPFLAQVLSTFTKAFDTEFDSFRDELLTLGSEVREEVDLASKTLQVSEFEAQALERTKASSFRNFTSQFGQTLNQELMEAKRRTYGMLEGAHLLQIKGPSLNVSPKVVDFRPTLAPTLAPMFGPKILATVVSKALTG